MACTKSAERRVRIVSLTPRHAWRGASSSLLGPALPDSVQCQHADLAAVSMDGTRGKFSSLFLAAQDLALLHGCLPYKLGFNSSGFHVPRCGRW